MKKGILEKKVGTTEFLNLEIEVTGLSAPQKRLINQLNSVVLELLNSKDEGSFFEKSSSLVNVAAVIVENSHFLCLGSVETGITKQENTDPEKMWIFFVGIWIPT